MRTFLAATIVIGAIASTALAIPDGWHRSMKEGQKSARGSGKPMLVVTLWKDGV